MKKLKKTIVFILCITLLSSIPIEAMAKTNGSDQQEQTESNKISFDAVTGDKDTEALIVDEIEGRRTEFSKEFMLADGNKMIAVYDQPVHYKNGENKWADYDNSLVVKDASKLTNKAGNIDITLSKNASDQRMVQFSSGNNTIAWKYENAGDSQLKAIAENEKHTGNEKFTNLSDVSSEALFPEVYKNVDMQYFLSSTGIKENIILKNADVQNEFYITYIAQNMTAEQIDDRTIIFKNKGSNEIYKLIAPYMIDANGEISTKLTFSLISQENGTIKVKLTADIDFITAPNRSFPITIDPEITKNFVGMFVMDEGEGDIKLNHGPYYISNNSYVITKVNNLPVLDEGEQIISAKFTYDITNGDTLFTSENESPIIFNAHKINTINGNYVSRDNLVLDYDSITYNDNEHISFDLTKLVKDWYAGTESTNGFIFEANDTVGSKQVNIKGRNNTDLNPSITIIYKDFKGTETGLSYHSFEAGENASASVSDYLGNLVVNQSLYDGTDTRFPLSLSATYNSIGNTWGFSFNQKITVTGAEMAALGYDYIYTDSSGTRHYLKKADDSDEWYDEDGIGVTLKVFDNRLELDNGNKQTYELPSVGGKLLSEEYENENRNTESDNYKSIIQYQYNSNGITINDCTVINKFVNISNNVVTSIQISNNKSIDFSYTNGLLTKIAFPGGRMSRYSYDNGKLISIEQADNLSGTEVVNSKLGFTYTGDKVTRVTQYGSDGTMGNYLNFAYGTDNTTTLTDKQEREEIYTFDNSGNRVSVLNANGFIENSAADGLIVTGGADSFTKNYITESINHTNNYLTQVNGSINNVTSNGGTLTIDTENKFSGENSVKILNPAENNLAFFTGGYHEFSAAPFVGKDVTFSAYVKTSDVQEIYNDGAVGASLGIVCYDSNNEVLFTGNSVGIAGTEGWNRLSVSANITSQAYKFSVFCNLRYASGTAWFDGMQLEEGNAANDLNVLQNADFSASGNWYSEQDTTVAIQNGTVSIGGVAGAYDDIEAEIEIEETTAEETEPSTYCVEETETSPNDYVYTYDDYGNQIQCDRGFVVRTVKKTYQVETTEATEGTLPETTESEETTVPVEPEPDDSLGNKYIYQTVNVDRAGVMFNIVGEAKADSVPLTNEKRTFGVALNIYYDGESTPETHYQEFNSNTNKRQSVALSVMPNYSEKTIDHIAFAFVYGYNKNTMTAYNAMLNVAEIGYPAEDDSSSEPTTEPASEEPTEAATLEPTEEPYDNYVDYEVLSESVDTSQPYMSSGTAYDEYGNYVVSETDEAGNEIEYEYDASGNMILYINDNHYLEYEYDAADNMILIGNTLAESTYSYNGFGNVSAISHNSFSYSFNYDIYNQLLSTAIGNVTIESNTYSADGLLTRTNFANGDYIQYAYDAYGNLTQISSENGAIAKFTYNKKGVVSKAEDFSANTLTYYQYDFSGNKIGEYRQNSAGDMYYRLGYDSNGNKVEKTLINGQTKTITSEIDDNGNTVVSNDGVTVSSSTDDFNRTTEVITSYGGTSDFSTLYTYRNQSNSNATTNNVHSITQAHGNNELLKYYYGFDSNGNITGVFETANMSQSLELYEYDWLNQLSIVIDKKNNTYTAIDYDDGGNITQVVKSNYDADINHPTTEIYRNIYTYGDSNWNDKLTAFNNQNITYDSMGNPLQYRDGLSFAWENGRQLHSVTQSGSTLTMSYDCNGLRTQKGNIHYYYDSDNNLIAMVNGSNTLFFYYDESGSVTSFSLGGSMYFYVKNLQGDIINIADSNGTILVRYDYDVFGKIVNITDYSDPNVTGVQDFALINPLRYRGYVYDDETGLYYLQSRYYDPVTGRFLNADVYVDTDSGSPLSTNMFAYCENSFVSQIDTEGKVCKRIISRCVVTYFNRKEAVDYAKVWYNSRNPKYYRYSKDCTNFVSQCLEAGGISYSSTTDENRGWFSYKKGLKWHGIFTIFFSEKLAYDWSVSRAWRICYDNFLYFQTHVAFRRILTIKNSYVSYSRARGKIQLGDILYFDSNGDGEPEHAAIVTSVKKGIYYSGHTDDCKDRDLLKYLNFRESKKRVYVLQLFDFYPSYR